MHVKKMETQVKLERGEKGDISRLIIRFGILQYMISVSR